MLGKLKLPSLVTEKGVLLETIRAEPVVELYRSTLGMDVERFHGNELALYECEETGIRWYSPAVPGDGAFYRDLRKHDWYYLAEKREFHHAAGYAKGKRILDIGCGSGQFAGVAGASSYNGLETSRAAYEDCVEQGLEVYCEDLDSFSRNIAEPYDCAFLFQVLEHVVDPFQFMKSTADCVRPGGIVFVSVPSEDSFVGMARNNVLNMPPHHLTRWTDRALAQLAERTGLELVVIRHEALDKLHLGWFVATRIRHSLDWMLRRPRSLVDVNKLDHGLSRLSRLLASVVKWGFLPFLPRLRGHTVSAVFRKPA